jgi:hypothetical protein
MTEIAKVSQQLEKEDTHRSELQDKYNRVMIDFKEAKITLDAIRVALATVTTALPSSISTTR